MSHAAQALYTVHSACFGSGIGSRHFGWWQSLCFGVFTVLQWDTQPTVCEALDSRPPRTGALASEALVLQPATADGVGGVAATAAKLGDGHFLQGGTRQLAQHSYGLWVCPPPLEQSRRGALARPTGRSQGPVAPMEIFLVDPRGVVAKVKVWQVLWGNKPAKKLHGKESGIQGVAKGHLQILTMYGATNASGLEVGKRSVSD